MAHVSVHYKIIIPGGHHRQPRNTGAELEPDPSSEVDVVGNIAPLYIPQLPYTMNGQNGLSQLLFWSVTDGSNGATFPAGPLTQSVGSAPLVITAWYWPISGPGVPGNGSAIIDDAFSAIKGDFIDDTFVTVTSDPSLTSNANVIGVVPTASAETLAAATHVASTTEPFYQWLSYGAGTPNGFSASLDVPKGSNGIAIAIYQNTGQPPPNYGKPGQYGIYGTVIGGVAVDGGGSIIINGVPHPVDPWGPLYSTLINASLAAAGSRAMPAKEGAEVRQLAARSVLTSIAKTVPRIEQGAKGE